MNLGARIERYGYELLPGILSETETKSLLGEVSKAELPRSRAGIRHLMGHPGVSRIAESKKILSIVRLVLGEDAIPFRATLFDKSPSSNWLVMWHQDTALPLFERKEIEGWGP
jgi:hypothetical protein